MRIQKFLENLGSMGTGNKHELPDLSLTENEQKEMSSVIGNLKRHSEERLLEKDLLDQEGNIIEENYMIYMQLTQFRNLSKVEGPDSSYKLFDKPSDPALVSITEKIYDDIFDQQIERYKTEDPTSNKDFEQSDKHIIVESKQGRIKEKFQILDMDVNAIWSHFRKKLFDEGLLVWDKTTNRYYGLESGINIYRHIISQQREYEQIEAKHIGENVKGFIDRLDETNKILTSKVVESQIKDEKDQSLSNLFRVEDAMRFENHIESFISDPAYREQEFINMLSDENDETSEKSETPMTLREFFESDNELNVAEISQVVEIVTKDTIEKMHGYEISDDQIERFKSRLTQIIIRKLDIQNMDDIELVSLINEEDSKLDFRLLKILAGSNSDAA